MATAGIDITLQFRAQGQQAIEAARTSVSRLNTSLFENQQAMGKFSQALGPAGAVVQRLAGPFAGVAAAALSARAAIGAFGEVLNNPKAYSATAEQLAKIEVLKARLSSLAAPLRLFTDSGFRAESAAVFLRTLSDFAGLSDEARSKAGALAAEQAIAAASAEKHADAIKALNEGIKQQAQYQTDLAAARVARDSSAIELAGFGQAPDIARLSRQKQSFDEISSDPGQSDLARARAQAESNRLALEIKRAESEVTGVLLDLEERQDEAARSKLSLEERVLGVRERLAAIDEQIAAGGDVAGLAKLELSRLSLEAERDRLTVEQQRLALDAQRLALDQQIAANQQAQAALAGNYQLTEAQKWQEKRRLIGEAIEAQRAYLGNLAAMASAPGATPETKAAVAGATISGQAQLGQSLNEQAALGADPNNLAAQLASSFTSLHDSWGTLSQQIAQGFTGTIGTAMQSTSDALYGLITGAQSMREAWQSVTLSIGQSFLRMTTDMVSKMIWRSTVERLLIRLGVIEHVTGEAAKTTATTAGFGARLALKIKEALGDVYHGAIKAFQAMASIPYVGPFLGAAAMAAAIAGGVALVKKIGGFEQGGVVASAGYTARAGRKTPVGVVHGGEWVAPAWMVEDPRYREQIAALEAERSGSRGFGLGGFLQRPHTWITPLTRKLTFGAMDSKLPKWFKDGTEFDKDHPWFTKAGARYMYGESGPTGTLSDTRTASQIAAEDAYLARQERAASLASGSSSMSGGAAASEPVAAASPTINQAFFRDEESARAWLQSREGRRILVDEMRRAQTEI